MLREPRRLISAAVAIVLGVAFVAATMLLGASLSDTMRREAAAEVGDAAVVVSLFDTDLTEQDRLTPDALRAVQSVPGVTGVRPAGFAPVSVEGAASRRAFVGVVPPLSATTTLTAGRLPAGADEIAPSAVWAAQAKVKVGDRVVVSPELDHAEATEPRSVTVVGIIRPGREVASADSPYLWVAADQFPALTGSTYLTFYVSGADPERLTSAVSATLQARGAHDVVRSHDAEIAKREKDLVGGVDALRNLLLAFAAIAVFVSAMVIANTFSITLAQRTRSLALLRCVGATRGQVFRSVLGESVLLGVVGSALGLGVGVGLAAGLIALSQQTELHIDRLAFTAPAVLVPLLVGLLVTVAASILPARSATRVAPLAALRPQLAAPATGRAGLARIVVGVLLFVGGAAALVYGATTPSVGIGVAGGFVNFAGLLVLGPIVIPAAVGVLGSLVRRTGVPGELAVENSRRNPRRAAATASALLVGVTLITTMSVGAASAQATEARAMEREFPTDALVLAAPGTSLPAGTVDKVRKTDGVAKAEPAGLATATVKAPAGDKTIGVYAIDPTAASVFRQASSTHGLRDGVILLDQSSGIKDGASVQVTIGGQTRTLTADVERDHLKQAVLTQRTMAEFGSDATASAVLVQYDAKASAWTVLSTLDGELSGEHVSVEGVSMGKAELDQVIGVILSIVTGLLAVSVLIALVGVANTLGLSILERTQESGLLRALGLTRGQLRAMVGTESLLLAVTAVVLGLVLGGAYGVAGVSALIKGQLTIVLDAPWLRLALVAVVAVGAGWLASVLPSLRAARVSPTQALATE